MIECLLECFNECINYCWYNRFLIDVLIRALIRLQSFRCESTINTNFLYESNYCYNELVNCFS